MRIGALADAVGVNPKTVRYYEDIGLLPKPERTASGYRDYTEVDQGRLAFVKTAQHLGLSLADIREILALRDRGEAPCAFVLDVLERQEVEVDRRIAELQVLRAELSALKTQADQMPQAGASYCPVIEHAIAGADDGGRGVAQT
ncbi:MAG: heavy metal-responsive transcriptional regulator [Acidimicrobiales bacterium]